MFMHNKNCKLAKISARCFGWENNCQYAQKCDKLAEISATPAKKRDTSV